MNNRINKAAVSVLVVEDNDAQRDVIHDILADEGYSVDTAESGERAICSIFARGFKMEIPVAIARSNCISLPIWRDHQLCCRGLLF